MLVLQKGAVSKEKFSSHHQVGVQRHRDFRLCAVFATSALVISKLRMIGDSLNCLYQKNVHSSWWDFPINFFETLEDDSHAMRQFLKDLDIDTCGKVTHNRLQAVQEAGVNNLNSDKICTMTKCMKDKLHQSYIPETNKVLIKVMSGLEKVSKYSLFILFYTILTIQK
jgi:hypothetical protein